MSTDEFVYNPIPPDERDPRIQAALTELRGLIAAAYPDATFVVYRGEEPPGFISGPQSMLRTRMRSLMSSSTD